MPWLCAGPDLLMQILDDANSHQEMMGYLLNRSPRVTFLDPFVSSFNVCAFA
jgi:hypothetical protein